MTNRKTYLIFALLVLVLTGCSMTRDVDLSASPYSQASAIKGMGGVYKIGKPYRIRGTTYYPKEDYNYSEVGMASWYGSDFHNKRTANGEKYDMNTLTAAHRTLPLPSIVKVTNLENGRSLVLRVNDRGPYAKNRIIDISKRGAQLLGYQTQGVAKVRVEILEKESRALKAALLGQKVDDTPMLPSPQKPAAETDKTLVIYNANTTTLSDIASSSGSYYVQAGAYKERSSAVGVLNRLSGIGSGSISETWNGLYRVKIGPFNSEAEADRALNEIQGRNVPAKVIKD